MEYDTLFRSSAFNGDNLNNVKIFQYTGLGCGCGWDGGGWGGGVVFFFFVGGGGGGGGIGKGN